MTLGPIDTHTHLDFSQFDKDREALIKECLEKLSGLVAVGTDLAGSRRSIDLASAYERIVATVGIHPHEADKVDDQMLVELGQLATKPKVVAIGECGLDYYRHYSEIENQKKLFLYQMELALELGLPLVVHLREAYDDGWEMLHRHYISHLAGRLPGVLHSFGSTPADAKRFLDDGWVLGINATLTYPKNEDLAEVVRETPLERLALETDCPYLPPQTRRGERNDPTSVLEIANHIAFLRQQPLEEIISVTNQTAQRMFKL